MLLFICVVSDYTIMSARKWSLRVSLFIVCALNSYEKLLSLKETVRICYHFVNCKWKSVDVIRISEQLMILLPLKEKVSISIFDWMEFWKGESFIVDWYILLYFGVLITNMIMKITNKVILTVICRAIWLSVTTQHACQYVLSCWKMDKMYNFFTTFHAKWLSSHLSALLRGARLFTRKECEKNCILNVWLWKWPCRKFSLSYS